MLASRDPSLEELPFFLYSFLTSAPVEPRVYVLLTWSYKVRQPSPFILLSSRPKLDAFAKVTGILPGGHGRRVEWPLYSIVAAIGPPVLPHLRLLEFGVFVLLLLLLGR